jgi:transposase InsO family protein
MSHELGSKPKKLFSGVKGYNSFMKTVISVNSFDKSQTAKYRLKVIGYYRRFGLEATLSAFPVKRSTLFLWQRKLRKSGGKLTSLIPDSTRPVRVRQMNTHPLILAEICRLRKKHYRLGKHKLYFLIKRFCESTGLNIPSESTIGKIIKRNNLFYSKHIYGYHDPNRKRPAKPKKIRVIKAPKPTQGGYVELDTIETVIEGIKRFTITAIDVKLKITYAQTFKSKHSRNALIVLKTLASILPTKIHTIQTDNGTEFEGEINIYCKREDIKRRYTYPHCPKINGVIERFNRSIQEEWLDTYQDEMLDIILINQRIREYLDFYHHDRIHESLNDQTPASIVGYNINYPKSPICM